MRPAATLNERVLAHLRDHPFHPDAAHAPREVTQDGIADAVGARVAHVSRALSALTARGLVEVHLARTAGAKRRSRAHAITPAGRVAAEGLVLERRDAPTAVAPRGKHSLRPDTMAALRETLDAALQEGPRVVLLEGDAGSGKSRLLAELREAAAAKRARWASGHAAPLGAEQTLGPLQEALAPLGLARRYQETPLGTPLERARRAAAQTLADAAPVVLALDDVHLAGASSVEFLHGVVRSLPADARVLVVVAFRREEAWELPNGPLYTALAPLGAPPRGRLLTLQPLDREGIERILQDAGHALEPRLVERVARESGGNPAYALAMAELFSDGVDESDFFPPIVQAAVKERFAALPRDALALLETAAVMGVELDPVLLARAHGATLDEVAAPLDALLDRLLLEEVETPEGIRVRFEHPKVREAALAEMSAARRGVVSARVARALTAPAQPA